MGSRTTGEALDGTTGMTRPAPQPVRSYNSYRPGRGPPESVDL